jgi:hypothetical protein
MSFEVFAVLPENGDHAVPPRKLVQHKSAWWTCYMVVNEMQLRVEMTWHLSVL